MRGEAAAVPAGHRLHGVERLPATDLADHDAVGTKAEGGPEEVADGDGAAPGGVRDAGLQLHDVVPLELQLARVLEHDHPFAVRHEGREGVPDVALLVPEGGTRSREQPLQRPARHAKARGRLVDVQVTASLPQKIAKACEDGIEASDFEEDRGELVREGLAIRRGHRLEGLVQRADDPERVGRSEERQDARDHEAGHPWRSDARLEADALEELGSSQLEPADDERERVGVDALDRAAVDHDVEPMRERRSAVDVDQIDEALRVDGVGPTPDDEAAQLGRMAK